MITRLTTADIFAPETGRAATTVPAGTLVAVEHGGDVSRFTVQDVEGGTFGIRVGDVDTVSKQWTSDNESEARRVIARAKRNDIDLTRADFTIYNGDLYLDSMAPGEWLDAMTMD